jgi:hypothetical protein
MRKLILLWASVLTLVLLASPVLAQNVMFVAPNGSDANSCVQAAPCATFQAAYNKGNVSQINCLGSGFYGAITVTASLTVDCGSGNVGNIVDSSVSGITISTTAAATIVLRHLALNGLGSAANGINASSFFSGTLVVEDCSISNYSAFGVSFIPGNGRGLLQMSNSQVFNNATGIAVVAASGQIASVTLNSVELIANSNDGLILGGNVVAGTMRKSVVGENANVGILAIASQVFFTVEESSIVANLANGIQTASVNAFVNVGASTIGGNGTGVLASQGAIISFGNNQMSVNATNGHFTTNAALQ